VNVSHVAASILCKAVSMNPLLDGAMLDFLEFDLATGLEISILTSKSVVIGR
jgi:hypothetical protein